MQNFPLSISRKFTPFSLIAFAMPSILMMVLMALYGIIDGIFVSRFVGSNALSSTNIVWPVINIIIAIGTMLATGGNAIISRYLGEGKAQKARECLSMFVVTGLLLMLIIMVVTLIFLEPICRLLGASDILLKDGMLYLKIIVCFSPACLLQSLYQCWLVTSGKPGLGLFFTTFAACANMFLDYYLIVIRAMGVAGAALATGIGQMFPAVFGSLFFAFHKGTLHFCRFQWNIREILSACYNGASEMVTQSSNAVVTFLFNIMMMRLVGETGVAAITILLYAQFLFNAFYMGFSTGVSPVLGFRYGAKDKKELRRIYRMVIKFVVVSSLAVTAVSMLLSDALLSVFTRDAQTFALASQGFRLFAFAFLFSGINIIYSGIFTALSNGRVSATISFTRTLLFTVASLLILPSVLGLDGIWLAVPCAELLTVALCFYFQRRYFRTDGVYFGI
ncbi:MAG: MATE family efflux transporter [Clostridiales bacterium]|nr:MATE family efflux transporter [Clostridiales bacterium]